MGSEEEVEIDDEHVRATLGSTNQNIMTLLDSKVLSSGEGTVLICVVYVIDVFLALIFKTSSSSLTEDVLYKTYCTEKLSRSTYGIRVFGSSVRYLLHFVQLWFLIVSSCSESTLLPRHSISNGYYM